MLSHEKMYKMKVLKNVNFIIIILCSFRYIKMTQINKEMHMLVMAEGCYLILTACVRMGLRCIFTMHWHSRTSQMGTEI